MNFLVDTQFCSGVIKEVTSADNGWSIKLEDGWTLFVTNENCKVEPSVGEIVAMFGKGIGYEVRGIVIGFGKSASLPRVYRYMTEAEHEADRRERHQRYTEDRLAANKKFVESVPSLPPLPAFCKTNVDDWNDFVTINSTDAYSYRIIQYAATWANLMEKRLSEGAASVAEIASKTASEADTDGITGFMYGAAVASLNKFWDRGEALRRWHNKELSPAQGDEANESGAVLNPALLTVAP